jgi:hypothetical protein
MKFIEIGDIARFNSWYYQSTTFQFNEIIDNNGNTRKYDLKIDLDDFIESKYSIYELSYLDILMLSDLEKIKKYSIRALD